MSTNSEVILSFFFVSFWSEISSMDENFISSMSNIKLDNFLSVKTFSLVRNMPPFYSFFCVSSLSSFMSFTTASRLKFFYIQSWDFNRLYFMEKAYN